MGTQWKNSPWWVACWQEAKPNWLHILYQALCLRRTCACALTRWECSNLNMALYYCVYLKLSIPVPVTLAWLLPHCTVQVNFLILFRFDREQILISQKGSHSCWFMWQVKMIGQHFFEPFIKQSWGQQWFPLSSVFFPLPLECIFPQKDCVDFCPISLQCSCFQKRFIRSQ